MTADPDVYHSGDGWQDVESETVYLDPTGLDHQPVEVRGTIRLNPYDPESPKPALDVRPKLEQPIAVSINEQQHQADLRARSIELAYLRGHLRRN